MEKDFKIKQSFLFFILLFFLLSIGGEKAKAQGCNLRLSGVIIDEATNKVLPNATLVLINENKIAVSNKSGVYKFNKLCAGSYRLKISHIGCSPMEINVIISEDTFNKNIRLTHIEQQLNEVVINAQSTKDINSIKSSLNANELEKTKGSTLGEMLKQINGVNVLQTGSTIFKPVVHGLHSQRVLILNNGVRQEGQQWGADHAPEIDPLLAGNLSVIKGAGALKYGSDAIGGAVLVEPKSLAISEGFHTEINNIYSSNNRMNLINAIVEHGGKPNSPWSWRSHLTYKQGGNARTPDYWLHNTGLKELNYSFHLGFQKPKTKAELFFSAFNTSLGIFWGAHIGNLTDLETAIKNEKPLFNIDAFTYEIGRPRQQASHYLLKAKLSQELAQGQQLNLVLSHQENIRKEYDRALINDSPELDLNIGTTIADVDYKNNYATNASFQIGTSLQRQENIWSGSRFFIPNYTAMLVGLYAIEKWKQNNLYFEAGLRYDYRNLEVFRNQNELNSKTTRNFNNVSSSFAINYLPNQKFNWQNNFSLSWRPPNVNELYVNGVHHGTANFEIGDVNLKSEKGFKYTTQLNYEWNKNTQIEATVYSNYVQNFINLVPIVPPTLTLRGAYPTFKFQQANALLTGADLNFGTHFSAALAYKMKASILLPRNLEANTWLQQMPAPQIDQEIAWYFKPNTKNSYLSANFVYVAKQTFVPSHSDDYLPPPPAYFLSNLNFATELHFINKPIIFGGSIYNLFNVKYRDYMNRFRYFTDDVGRNIVIRLKIKFFCGPLCLL
ncbi:MAG: TonB-dependent receptor [Sphingobacteriaceae bacterium]|nr:TonB-dependent receptor [Sphingobacteriaceae bacterium]